MEAREVMYPWKTAQALPRTSGNTEGYVRSLLLPFPMLILRQSRPATEDDILRLCHSFHNLTREFMEEVVAELRKGNTWRGDPGSYTADDESDGDVPRQRLRKPKSKYPGVRRRPAEQNVLSVCFFVSLFPPLIFSQRQIRAHMKDLIRGDWLKEVVTQHDLNDWNPDTGECCTAVQFKIHLKGTPCDPWNTSATRVFTNDFLRTHAEQYPDVWAVRRMVLKKTQAYIKSLIKAFREGLDGGPLKLAARRAKNRRERKTNVSPRGRFFGVFCNSSVLALPSSSRHYVRIPADGTTATNARSSGCRWHVQ